MYRFEMGFIDDLKVKRKKRKEDDEEVEKSFVVESFSFSPT